MAGCLCLLMAYFLGGFYSILVRKLSKQFSSFELTYIMFTVGFSFFAVMAFITHGGNTISMLTAAVSNGKFIVACLYLGVAASVGAYMLANYSLATLPVSRATIFNSFATIVSVLSGVVLMGDPLTLTSGISFIMILVGVFGVNRFTDQN